MALTAAIGGCQGTETRTPPPDARRPQLQTEAELREARRERIESGTTVKTSSPDFTPQPSAPRRSPRLEPITPGKGAIKPDILLVNDQVVTVAEILYPLWDQLREVHASSTAEGFRAQARRMLRRETQRTIGSLLIYDQARSELSAEQAERLDAMIDKRIEDIVSVQYGGSEARLHARLAEHGLPVEQFRRGLMRDMVVQQYSREKLLPKIQIRRAELLDAYNQRLDEYSRPETRELQMIELPFEAYLPDGASWEQATRMERARAKLTAADKARAAHAALAAQPWEAVVREYSKGLKVDEGGSWGLIGRPLRPPFDELSQRIFGYASGQYSAPIELESGWYIVRCGEIKPAMKKSFVEVQDELRNELMESRFARLSTEYVLDLADKATISSLDTFLDSAIERAVEHTEELAAAE